MFDTIFGNYSYNNMIKKIVTLYKFNLEQIILKINNFPLWYLNFIRIDLN